MDEAADACVAEIQSARLVLIKENEAVRVEWAEGNRRDWTEPERARLDAIGRLAASGVGLDAYLGLCAEMDERLARERRRLAETARREKFPLRSRSFALAYYGFGNQIGFTHVARASQPGLREMSGGAKKREVSLAEMSSGQLHFFLENRHAFFGDYGAGRFAEELIYILRERFRWEPYHVQLAALFAVGFARQAPEETLGRLVEAIGGLDVSPANWGINTSIIDALKILGALDDEGEESREQIKRDLASVLGDDEDKVDRDLALSLCLRMFDHPFDSIYAEEIFKLDGNLHRRLYRRALGAHDIKMCPSLGWISGQVASFENVSDAPLFQPLAILPDPSNPFAQEEWAGFVLATRFLGRHGAELPPIDGESPADRCLADIRTLIYAAESRQQSGTEAAQLAWQKLHAMPAQLVIGCLSEVHDALFERLSWGDADQSSYQPLNLVEVYPADCLKVARRFVEGGMEAQYFYQVRGRDLGLSFAFGTIGRYGNRGDIYRLRGFSHSDRFARHALAAIKSLDAVSAPGS